jgi:4-aminobutyrate--pyruvate transaminase
VKDKKTREKYDPALKVGQRVQDAAHAGGLYLRSIPPDRISFMPPLIIEENEIDDALAILRKALDIVYNELD